MSDVTHTPGPWRVETGTTLAWGHCDPEDMSTYGMGFPVAEALMASPSWGRHRYKLSPEIAEANARLISAAPDGLEIAQELLAFARSGGSFVYPAGMLQKLERFVAKATGRTA